MKSDFVFINVLTQGNLMEQLVACTVASVCDATGRECEGTWKCLAAFAVVLRA